MAICNVTGAIAIYNPSKNIFMSPMADGPVNFTSTDDIDNIRIDNVSQHGRSFSIVNVPYSLKLLMHELQTINVHMKIITEDNIQQFDNMAYSKNIQLLLSDKNSTPKTVVRQIKDSLVKSDVNKLSTPEDDQNSTLSPLYNRPDDTSTPSPEWNPLMGNSTLNYQPTENKYPTPIFNGPNSPQYEPVDGNTQYSPSYSPPEVNSPPTVTPLPHSPDGQPTPELDNNFNVGDAVHYRSDSNHNRIWYIQNIGDNFITINTSQTDGLDKDEIVKVVTSLDIYKLSDAPRVVQPNTFQLPENTTQPNTPTPNSSIIPPINIKIVNGSDYSSTPTTSDDQSENSNEIIIPSSNTDNTNNIEPIRFKSSLSTDASPPERKIEESSDIFKGGLIIKKMD
jgi:hypothetical protein